MEKVGIIASSNALSVEERPAVEKLASFLAGMGKEVVLSRCLYETAAPFSAPGAQRAAELMKLFQDREVTQIFDISGGNLGNEVLDFLDYKEIAQSSAVFWGYSDLTTILNAIWAKTGKPGVLWQAKHLVTGETQTQQRERFAAGEDLFSPRFQMVQGESLKGVVVGGNIRCFLKLAGTPYFPDLTEKILLLEARSGQTAQMVTYLSQLRSMGVFGKIRGVLLGTFTEMEARRCQPDLVTLVRSFAGPDLPIARTPDIGHSPDARAIWIGRKIEIK